MARYPYEVLYSNKWLEVRDAEMPNDGHYIYQHAPWCKGRGVAILAYRETILGRQYLGRYEICPAHSDQYELTSITGGCDKQGESYLNTAVRELEEEGGIKLLYPLSDVRFLGDIRPSKSSDNTMWLYCVGITEQNHEVVEAVGDGTAGEDGAWCEWVSEDDYIQCKDPVVATMILRLKQLNI